MLVEPTDDVLEVTRDTIKDFAKKHKSAALIVRFEAVSAKKLHDDYDWALGKNKWQSSAKRPREDDDEDLDHDDSYRARNPRNDKSTTFKSETSEYRSYDVGQEIAETSGRIRVKEEKPGQVYFEKEEPDRTRFKNETPEPAVINIGRKTDMFKAAVQRDNRSTTFKSETFEPLSQDSRQETTETANQIRVKKETPEPAVNMGRKTIEFEQEDDEAPVVVRQIWRQRNVSRIQPAIKDSFRYHSQASYAASNAPVASEAVQARRNAIANMSFEEDDPMDDAPTPVDTNNNKPESSGPQDAGLLVRHAPGAPQPFPFWGFPTVEAPPVRIFGMGRSAPSSNFDFQPAPVVRGSRRMPVPRPRGVPNQPQVHQPQVHQPQASQLQAPAAFQPLKLPTTDFGLSNVSPQTQQTENEVVLPSGISIFDPSLDSPKNNDGMDTV